MAFQIFFESHGPRVLSMHHQRWVLVNSESSSTVSPRPRGYASPLMRLFCEFLNRFPPCLLWGEIKRSYWYIQYERSQTKHLAFGYGKWWHTNNGKQRIQDKKMSLKKQIIPNRKEEGVRRVTSNGDAICSGISFLCVGGFFLCLRCWWPILLLVWFSLGSLFHLAFCFDG